jgi:hypothetical protein
MVLDLTEVFDKFFSILSFINFVGILGNKHINWHKSKVHPIACHKGTEGKQQYSYSFFNLGARCGR